jgi:hypothetical protein
VDGNIGSDGHGEAALGSFCATTQHVFCVDFDEGKAVGDGWDDVSVCTNGCTLGVDTTVNAPSPPGALHATTPTGRSSLGGASVLQTRVSRVLGNVTSSVHLSISVRIDALDPNQSAQLLTANFGQAGNEYLIDFGTTASGAFIEQEVFPLDGGNPYYPSVQLDRGFVLGQWTVVNLVITFGSPSTVSVTFDGAPVGTVKLDPGAHAGTLNVGPRLGYYTNEVVQATSAFYDNFAIDIP